MRYFVSNLKRTLSLSLSLLGRRKKLAFLTSMFAGILVFGILALGATLTIGGFGGELADGEVYAESTASTSLDLEVPTVLSITTSTNLINVEASENNKFYTGSVSIDVKTNNPTGYKLSMANNDSNTSLVSSDSADTIDSIAEDITLDSNDPTSSNYGANFTTNKWAYSITNSSASYMNTSLYKPIPLNTAAADINLTTTPAATSNTTISFGTKVDKNLAAGTYADTVVFTAIANAVPRNYLKKLLSLQDMANHPEYCTNSDTGATALLPDIRDNKTYRIRKLLDGNCWMIDNLRLGTVGQDLVLTPADTNLTAGREVMIAAGQIIDSDGANWFAGSTEKLKYETWHIYNREDQETTNYGNLYNYWTATAGSIAYDAPLLKEASDSICPKGWQLQPRAGDKSYRNLVDTYLPNGNTNQTERLRETLSGLGPEFTYGGTYRNSAISEMVGSNGWYAYRTTRGYYDDTGYYLSYYMRFSDTSVATDTVATNQYFGYSVRCVAS